MAAVSRILVLVVSFAFVVVLLTTFARSERVDEIVPAFTSYRIDLNTTDAPSLMLLRGIGVKTAEKIVDDREANGAFESVEDLMRVKGVGEKTLEGLREWVVVGAKE